VARPIKAAQPIRAARPAKVAQKDQKAKPQAEIKLPDSKSKVKAVPEIKLPVEKNTGPIKLDSDPGWDEVAAQSERATGSEKAEDLIKLDSSDFGRY